MQFDPTLRDIVQELTRKYRCHTVILYGSNQASTRPQNFLWIGECFLNDVRHLGTDDAVD